jgi:Conjugative transposon protein TcpC
MVRGPKSGDGAWSSVHYLDSAGLVPPRALYSDMDPLAAGTLAGGSLVAAEPGSGWSGAGGRWLRWPPRVLLWTALLVVAFRGITAIVLGQGAASPGGGTGSASTASGRFPAATAEAYAAEFGRVYLGFSPQDQAQREQALAAFVPASVLAADPDLGWNGAGQLNVQSEQVAGITVQDPRHAVVTLLALVNGQLMELGVPVAVSGGGVLVSGEPAWLPAPPQAPLPATAPGGSDPVARGQLMNELPAFFQAYASGDSAALSKFEVRGVSLTGLGGAVTFDSVSALHVPPGGASRQITVTVIWQLPEQAGAAAGNLGMASQLQMPYGMSVVDLHTGKWYVKEIGASTEAVGAR